MCHWQIILDNFTLPSISSGIEFCHADLKTMIGLAKQSIKSKTKLLLSFLVGFTTSSKQFNIF